LTAWTDPPTFVLDQLVTPTHMNTYLRDNTLALMHPVGSREFASAGPSNTLTETSLYTSPPTIPGGAVGTSGTFVAYIAGLQQQFFAGLSWTWRVYLGATAVLTYTQAGGNASGTEGAFWLEVTVEALGAANAQAILVKGGTKATQAVIPTVAYATSSVDLSADRVFDVKVQVSHAGVGDHALKQFSKQMVGKN
jgi:hypothetical protein